MKSEFQKSQKAQDNVLENDAIIMMGISAGILIGILIVFCLKY